jgi:hypothetical protein
VRESESESGKGWKDRRDRKHAMMGRDEARDTFKTHHYPTMSRRALVSIHREIISVYFLAAQVGVI